jgi:hypothetical protein
MKNSKVWRYHIIPEIIKASILPITVLGVLITYLATVREIENSVLSALLLTLGVVQWVGIIIFKNSILTRIKKELDFWQELHKDLRINMSEIVTFVNGLKENRPSKHVFTPQFSLLTEEKGEGILERHFALTEKLQERNCLDELHNKRLSYWDPIWDLIDSDCTRNKGVELHDLDFDDLNSFLKSIKSSKRLCEDYIFSLEEVKRDILTQKEALWI